MTWAPDATRILSIDEVRAVLARLKRYKSFAGRRREIVFRLATCCGLRVTEIRELNVGDCYLNDLTSGVKVRTALKRGKVRTIPLHRDRDTYEALCCFIQGRLQAGAGLADPLLITRTGQRVHRTHLRQIFKQACRPLGPERVRQLTIHSGRHTAASFLFHIGVPAPEIQALMGHASLAMTSCYAHIMAQQPTQWSNVWG